MQNYIAYLLKGISAPRTGGGRAREEAVIAL
jgi:hypothetical protein